MSLWAALEVDERETTTPCRAWMEESKNREQLERKIARYKALARQVDDEAALRIEELVRELEQQLQSQQ